MSNPETTYRLDEIDRQIIHALMADARNTTAPMIAEHVNVSSGTVRNRINQLEEHGILRGYHANVDFESAEEKHTYLYVCSAPVGELEAVAQEVLKIRGVINVRELMSGTSNLHVFAVGQSTAEFSHTIRSLAELDLEIVDKSLVTNERFEPYAPYGAEGPAPAWEPTDLVRLAGGTDVVEVVVSANAPIVDVSLAEAAEQGILNDDALVVAVERDGYVLTPRGETVIQQDDVITLVSRVENPETVLEAFHEHTQPTA